MSAGRESDDSKTLSSAAASADWPIGSSNLESPIVHLHIGMPKSGSSAIQQWLHQHRQQLGSRKLIIPRVGLREGAHYGLVRELRDHEPLKLWQQALDAEGSENSRIISAEGLWFCSREEVERLADVLSHRVVQVHVYLREPGAFLRSLYRQRIKGSGRYESIAEFLAQPESCVDYPQIIGRWKRSFDVRVALYEAQREQIVSDFARAIGLDDWPADERRELNTTPCDGALRLMACANRCLPSALARWARRSIQWTHPLWNWLGSIDDSMLSSVASQERRGWAISDLVSLGISVDDLRTWERSY